jgi:hypothetical protein
MNIQETYLEYLNEKDEKKERKIINPKLKTAGSWYAVSPASDVTIGGVGTYNAYKDAKSKGKVGKELAKDMGKHFAKGVVYSIALLAAYRFIRAKLDKCHKSCGTYSINNVKRQFCILNCQKSATESQIQAASKEKSFPPEKMNKLKSKLDTLNSKVRQYQEYIKKNPIKQEKEKKGIMKYI